MKSRPTSPSGPFARAKGSTERLDPHLAPRPTDSATVGSPAETDTVDVSVIIVTYNVREFLEQALESVRRASAGLTVETFVVDNDSADGSAEMIRDRFPEVRLIANTDNVGFATANNQAIRKATGRHLLILNPDTLLQEDSLRVLVDFMDDHPEAGAVGCRILNPDGTFAPESRRAFPTPSVAFYRLSGLSKLFPNSPTVGRYNLTYLPQNEVCEVDALSGSCMMVRRAAVWGTDGDASTGAGLFDEAFFMYGEDLDWCYRIQQAGWRIYYTPDTQIVHYKGESTKKGDMRYVMLFYGAMLRFVEKHLSSDAASPSAGSRFGASVLAGGIRVGILVRGGLAALGRLGRSLSAPLTDGLLALLMLTATAGFWSVAKDFAFDALYYTVVLPAYTAAVVVGIGAAGGYRHRSRRSVVLGVLSAFVAASTLSFLIPDIAYSRGTLVLGTALTMLALVVRRHRARPARLRRTLFVGDPSEAERLMDLAHTRAPEETSFHLLGVIGEGETADVPRLGSRRHLRDLARLHHADEVVFSADSLTNTTILDSMRALRDSPVDLKIFASSRDRVIGKASVEDFSAPLMDAERLVAPLRSPATHRAFEMAVALLAMAAKPFVELARTLRPSSTMLERLRAYIDRMPDVLAGRIALIGYDPDGPHPPEAWGLRPGLISILDILPERPDSIVAAHRAYWFYARNQSFTLDLQIFSRAVASS